MGKLLPHVKAPPTLSIPPIETTPLAPLFCASYLSFSLFLSYRSYIYSCNRLELVTCCLLPAQILLAPWWALKSALSGV